MVDKTPYHEFDIGHTVGEAWDYDGEFDKLDKRLELRGALADRPTTAPDGAKFVVDDPADAEHGATFIYRTSDGSWHKQPVNAESVDTEQATINGRESYGDLSKIVLVPDVHYGDNLTNDISPANSTVDSNMEAAINHANAINADRVIIIGDYATASGPHNGTVSDWYNDTQHVHDKFEAEVADGIVVDHVLGNHEYDWAGTEGMSNMYDILGYNGLEDTFYTVDAGGWKLIILNNSYTTTDYTTDKSEHIFPNSDDPFDAYAWLEGELDDTDKPVALIAHHPFTPGDGTDYDAVDIEDEVIELINQYPNVSLSIFGHSHHNREFKRHGEQFDSYGLRHINIGNLNNVDEDTSTPQFSTLYLARNSWHIVTNYQGTTVWPERFSGTSASRVPIGAASSRDTTIENSPGTLEDYVQNTSGSGTISRKFSTIMLQTGTTSGSKASAHYEWDDLGANFDTAFEWSVTANFTTDNSAVENYLIMGTPGSNAHVGFYMLDGAMYAKIRDGSGGVDQQVQISQQPSGSNKYRLSYRPDNGVSFYINQHWQDTLTFDAMPKLERFITLQTTNSDASNEEIILSNWTFKQRHETKHLQEIDFRAPF